MGRSVVMTSEASVRWGRFAVSVLVFLLAWLIYSGALLVLPVLLLSMAAWAAGIEWVRRVRS